MMDERAEVLRREILAKVAEYHALRHAPAAEAEFVPGVSRINYAGRVFGAEEMQNLVDASLEFWLTGGRYARAFEERLAALLGVRRALLVNSGSSANLLAFMALTAPELGERRIERGDEVITVAAGFPTTVAPIVQYGAVPVFVDVEVATANVEVGLLEGALSARSKAVMLAHTLGNPFDAAAVRDFCDRHGLWLVEDNCDALGARFAGRATGAWGDVGTSSFYPPHHLTMGEGGAVYANDPQLLKILLSLRDWGRDCWCDPGVDNTCGCRFSGQFGQLPEGYDHKYVYSRFGYNLKATDLQAAIGCAQLERLPEFVRRRRENFARLREGLADVESLEFLRAHPLSEPSWFGFMMTRRPGARFTRNDLAQFLEQHLIQTRNLFAGNLLRHPCFESLVEGRDFRVAGALEATDRIMHDALWVGVYPGMRAEHVDYMVDRIRAFCRG